MMRSVLLVGGCRVGVRREWQFAGLANTDGHVSLCRWADVILSGSRVAYTTVVLLSNGTRLNGAGPISWSIDNASIAVIDEKEVLPPQDRGTLTITAAYQERSARATVRVLVPGENDNLGAANLVIAFSLRFRGLASLARALSDRDRRRVGHG
jgi:hypothetical protein